MGPCSSRKRGGRVSIGALHMRPTGLSTSSLSARSQGRRGRDRALRQRSQIATEKYLGYRAHLIPCDAAVAVEWNGVAEVLRFPAHEQINERFSGRGNFADIIATFRRACSRNSVCANAESPCNEKRARQVEILGHDDDGIGEEDMPRPIHAAIRIKSGMIEKNIFSFDTRIDEVLAHGCHFVVGECTVVAGDEYFLDFARAIELERHFRALLEYGRRLAADDRCSEDERRLRARHILRRIVYVPSDCDAPEKRYPKQKDREDWDSADRVSEHDESAHRNIMHETASILSECSGSPSASAGPHIPLNPQRGDVCSFAGFAGPTGPRPSADRKRA